MKQVSRTIRRYLPWLLLLLGMDCFFILLLWLSDAKEFGTLCGILMLASMLMFAAVLWILCRKEKQKRAAFEDFLSSPDAFHREKLTEIVSEEEKKSILLLASVLEQKQLALSRSEESLSDYEEYVEGWAHEAKTPVSLLTMILDNRVEEMSVPVRKKLDYIRSQLQEDVTQMLYYARLKGTTKDYLLEPVDLHTCIEDVLEDYTPLLEEKQFEIRNNLISETVCTDRRGMQFMLGQIISNAIKYSGAEPVLTFSLEHSEKADILRISDNGIGMKSFDLPYVFQKGFTGDSMDSRKKATGMGLYLTKKMADDLGLGLNAESQWGKGFTILISFPKVEMT